MSFDQHTFTYAQQGAMTVMVCALIDRRTQFAVSPFPQEINAQQTGWIVSFPHKAQDRIDPPKDERPGNDPEPSEPQQVAA